LWFLQQACQREQAVCSLVADGMGRSPGLGRLLLPGVSLSFLVHTG
jgi:hypothetical protein